MFNSHRSSGKRTLRRLALAGIVTLAGHAHAQTLLNGSFELPALTAGAEGTGSGDNWTLTGSAFIETNGHGLGTTPYGNQWNYLNGNNSADSQTISGGFTPNTSYTLSVAALGYFGNLGDQLTLTISGGGLATPVTQNFAVVGRTVFGGSPLLFGNYSLAFTPQANAPVTITLANTSTNDVLALDNVVLAPTGGVPEPSTWALMLGGTGLLGWWRRRDSHRRRHCA